MSDKSRQGDDPSVQVCTEPDSTVRLTINYNQYLSMGASFTPQQARTLAESLIWHAEKLEAKR